MTTVNTRADKWLEVFNQLFDDYERLEMLKMLNTRVSLSGEAEYVIGKGDDVTTYVNAITNISDVFGGYWNVSNQKTKEPKPPKPKKIPYPTWGEF